MQRKLQAKEDSQVKRASATILFSFQMAPTTSRTRHGFSLETFLYGYGRILLLGTLNKLAASAASYAFYLTPQR
jgi:hypothetical protein